MSKQNIHNMQKHIDILEIMYKVLKDSFDEPEWVAISSQSTKVLKGSFDEPEWVAVSSQSADEIADLHEWGYVAVKSYGVDTIKCKLTQKGWGLVKCLTETY